MNCKPGDLAVVMAVSNPLGRHHLGMIVEVLYAAPSEFGKVFEMPDGALNRRNLFGPAWICKKPYPAKHWSTGRLTLYGTFLDSALKPLRDPDQTIESEQAISVE